MLYTRNNGKTWNLIDTLLGYSQQNNIDHFGGKNNINGLRLVIHAAYNYVDTTITSSVNYYDESDNNISTTNLAYRYINKFISLSDNITYRGDYLTITCNPCIITGYGFNSLDSSVNSWILIGSTDLLNWYTVEIVNGYSGTSYRSDSINNTTPYNNYRLVFTKSSGAGIIQVTNIYFLGPNGNYTLTQPSTHTIQYPVKYPPILDLTMPCTISNYTYGNGTYREIYNGVTSSTFGTYISSGPGSTLTMIFPFQITLTSYSMTSSSGWSLTCTNNDIYVYTIDSQQSGVDGILYPLTSGSFYKYTFTFSAADTYSSLVYYANYTVSPYDFGPLLWVNESGIKAGQSTTVINSDLTVVMYSPSKLESFNGWSFNPLTNYISIRASSNVFYVNDEFTLVNSIGGNLATPSVSSNTFSTAQEYMVFDGILPENTIVTLVKYLKLKWEI